TNDSGATGILRGTRAPADARATDHRDAAHDVTAGPTPSRHATSRPSAAGSRPVGATAHASTQPSSTDGCSTDGCSTDRGSSAGGSAYGAVGGDRPIRVVTARRAACHSSAHRGCASRRGCASNYSSASCALRAGTCGPGPAHGGSGR
ncbi:hypothetical protein AB0M20_35625, partial [Actinoplanes sp. NPDC051633]|uniref:hypothetical protein n=1 Tax=Actinoplanes sp. NPDC051633 TaxID=3155670 RepID=UPI003421DE2D